MINWIKNLFKKNQVEESIEEIFEPYKNKYEVGDKVWYEAMPAIITAYQCELKSGPCYLISYEIKFENGYILSPILEKRLRPRQTIQEIRQEKIKSILDE